MVISGCNSSDWLGYSFGNIGPVDTSPIDAEGSHDGDIIDEDCRVSCSDDDEDPEPEEDFFATGGCEPVLNPENTIWDPRIYFLLATQTRLTIMAQVSEHLVRKLDSGCQDWVSHFHLEAPVFNGRTDGFLRYRKFKTRKRHRER